MPQFSVIRLQVMKINKVYKKWGKNPQSAPIRNKQHAERQKY